MRAAERRDASRGLLDLQVAVTGAAAGFGGDRQMLRSVEEQLRKRAQGP